MHSTRRDTWDMFDLPQPVEWPPLAAGKRTVWYDCSLKRAPIELESGQMVFNKKKAWNGLMMTAFINQHHQFFLKQLFEGDKQTFSFGFNATETAYSVSKKHPIGIGLQTKLPGNKGAFFCSNTMGQRHPITGDLVFMHRNAAKFSGSVEYLSYDPVPRAWMYTAKLGIRDPWAIMFRDEAPAEVFVPHYASQVQCLHPVGSATIRPVDKNVCSTPCLTLQHTPCRSPSSRAR